MLIESLHAMRKARSLVINPEYLDDEKLPEEERTRVLQEIFKRNIREKQLSRIISHLAPILDGIHPPSVMVYGPTGSGKTVTLMHVLPSFKKVAEKKGILFRYAYIDLTSPKSYFGALNELALALDGAGRCYRKGIPIEYMQGIIRSSIKDYDGFLCLLIDEADNIRPSVNPFLTFLVKTLPRRVSCRIILIMLTNRLDWERSVDPRIMSFLKKTDLIFEPYDAMDLVEILKLRVEKALDTRKVDPAAIQKMAALASRETGDARKAVELLATAVKVAEERSGRLTEEEVDIAVDVSEVDKTEAMIKSLAIQQRMALIGCYKAIFNDKGCTSTGRAYSKYRDICAQEAVRPLTQRRFSDMVRFLDLYGLVSCRVRSKGRYGTSRDITDTLPAQVVTRIVKGIV